MKKKVRKVEFSQKITIGHTVKQILGIGIVTFHELVREKILWSTLLFAFLCVGLSYALSRLSFVENARIALDFGLTAVSLIGGLLSIVMGASLIAKEIENRTVYVVLSKAVWRWQFVVGRLLGLFTVLILNATLMTLVLLLIFVISGGHLSSAIFKSLVLQITEFGVLASMACIFSSFSTVSLAAIFASGVWVIGHAMEDLRAVTDKIEPVSLRPILHFITFVLPDLTRFDVKVQVSHQLPITWGYTNYTIFYGLAYMAFAILTACTIFSRRDL